MAAAELQILHPEAPQGEAGEDTHLAWDCHECGSRLQQIVTRKLGSQRERVSQYCDDMECDEYRRLYSYAGFSMGGGA